MIVDLADYRAARGDPKAKERRACARIRHAGGPLEYTPEGLIFCMICGALPADTKVSQVVMKAAEGQRTCNPREGVPTIHP